MRLQARRAGKRPGPHISHLTGQPIAPGKRALTWYLEPAVPARHAEEDPLEANAMSFQSFRGGSASVSVDSQGALALTRDLGNQEQPGKARAVPSRATRSSAQDIMAPGTIAYRRFQANLAAALGHFDELEGLEAEGIDLEPGTVVETAESKRVRVAAGEYVGEEPWVGEQLWAGADASEEIDDSASGPLPRALRTRMERAFGQRFDHVRTHQDSPGRVSSLAQSAVGMLQPKLTIGPVRDRYEREADEVADRVMRMSTPVAAYTSRLAPDVRDQLPRAYARCEEEDAKLLRKEAGSSPDVVPPIVHEVLRSPGRPLDVATRAFMEPRFGHDFSQVRIHADAKAAESARAVNALAYTVGRDVVFGAARYEPGTEAGRRLLAHELAHVVQQGGGQSDQARAQRGGAAQQGGALGGARPTLLQRQHEPEPAPVAGERSHVVQAGETLSEIAWAQYRDVGMADAIARANGLTDPNRIVPGQALVLPPAPVPPSGAAPGGAAPAPAPTTARTQRLVSPLHYAYVVAQGDSLSRIVHAEYGDASYVSLVAQRNAIPAPNYPIFAGATLALPPVVVPAHPTHVVASGESLSTIARDEYDDAELWPAVAQALGLAAPFGVNAGTTLTLPPVAARGANLPRAPVAAAAPSSQPSATSVTPTQPGPAGAPDAGRPPQAAVSSRDAGRPPQAAASPMSPAGTVTAGPPDAGAPPQTPAAAPPATHAPPSVHPSSQRTTPGPGASPRQQAAAEWAQYRRRIKIHFGDQEPFERYVTLRPKYQNMGIANPAEYIARNIGTVHFFGARGQAHVAHMQPLLRAAEQNLRARGIVPTISSMGGFVPRDIRGSATLSNHATGHAIDLDDETNPLLRDPQGATFRVIAAATGTDFRSLPRERQGSATVHTRAAIEEMRRAGERFGQVFNPAWVARQRARLQELRRQSAPSREQRDERTELEGLVAALDLLAARAARRQYGNLNELRAAAGSGFISLSTELIEELRNVGFRWGGDYEESRDFMHFELDRWV
jgi:LysM repeat protein